MDDFSAAAARACYRIVSEPSWQVQVERPEGWRTIWYCASEWSAKRQLEKCNERFMRGPLKLSDILR